MKQFFFLSVSSAEEIVKLLEGRKHRKRHAEPHLQANVCNQSSDAKWILIVLLIQLSEALVRYTHSALFTPIWTWWKSELVAHFRSFRKIKFWCPNGLAVACIGAIGKRISQTKPSRYQQLTQKGKPNGMSFGSMSSFFGCECSAMSAPIMLRNHQMIGSFLFRTKKKTKLRMSG